MSAAATAAGYLYASGRLRGRTKDAEEPERRQAPAPQARRRQIRIAALPERELVQEAAPAPRARPAPRIEYRVRRWRPE